MAEGGAQRRALLVGLGMGILGAGLLGLAIVTLHGFVSAVVHRAPIIMWDEGGWIALPIALALLVLVLALYIGRNHGPDVDRPRSDAIKRLLTLAACLLPFVIVFPLSAHWLAGQHLEARGYIACGRQFWIAADRMPDARAALARCEVWRRG